MEAFRSTAAMAIVDPDPELVWALALLAALSYGVYRAQRSALEPRTMYWAGLCAMAGGIWGSHVLGLMVRGSYGDGLAWLRVWSGGKSYYGGLLGGALAGGVFLWVRRCSVLSYLDAGIPAVALGYAIGRVGCFLNGDDYGTLSQLPWSVRYPPGTEAYAAHLSLGWIDSTAPSSLPVHPVQLYAALWGAVMFVLLVRWRSTHTGGHFCLFAWSYGVGRFVTEWLRGDFQAVLGPLSLPQLCSVLLALLGAAVWFGVHTDILNRIRSYSVFGPRAVGALDVVGR
jgi:phosphatidylglycerol:prolipoprotein diacylglycerol transferase